MTRSLSLSLTLIRGESPCVIRHFDSDSASTPSLGRRHRLARELARDNAFCAIA